MADIEGGDIIIRFGADTSELDSAVEGTKDTLDSFVSEVGVGADELKGLGAEAGKTSKAMQGLNNRGIGALSGILRVVNPELATGLIVFQNLRRVMPTLTASVRGFGVALKTALPPLLAIAAAVELLALIESDLQVELDLATDAMKRQAAEATHAQDAHKAYKTSVLDTEKAYKLFTGEITEADAAIEEFNQKIDAQTEAMLRHAHNADIAADIRERRDETKRMNEEMVRAAEAERALADEAGRVADAESRINDILAGRTSAEKARTESIKASMDELNEYVRFNAERIDDAFSEVEEALEGVVAKMEAEIQQAALVRQTAVGAVGDTLQAVGDISSTISTQLVDDNTKAARALFRTSQAAGIAQVAINTAVAMTKAFADLGPVAGGIAAGGLFALGAAQTVAIASQKAPAHMGDPLAPDEARTSSGRRVLQSEAVLDSATYRRLGGEDGMRAMMRGGSPQRDTVVVSTYKGKVMDRENARLMRENSRTARTAQRIAARAARRS